MNIQRKHFKFVRDEMHGEPDEIGTGCECPNCANGMGMCHTEEAQTKEPKQEPVGRTDQQIVDQTEELAVYLLSWCFNHKPETSTPMRDSTHPFAQRCWAAACHIQEMLTNTDPENAVAELDCTPTPPQRKPLTDGEFISMVDSDGIKVEPELAFTIKEMVERAHGIYPENSDCHGPDWTDRDGEYLK